MTFEARLQKKESDGQPTKKHLAMLARLGVKSAIAQLVAPAERPEELEYLWSWFLTLSGTRRVGMNGLERISMSDLDAANRLFHWQLRPYEVEALLLIDFVYLFPEALQKKKEEDA